MSQKPMDKFDETHEGLASRKAGKLAGGKVTFLKVSFEKIRSLLSFSRRRESINLIDTPIKPALDSDRGSEHDEKQEILKHWGPL